MQTHDREVVGFLIINLSAKNTCWLRNLAKSVTKTVTYHKRLICRLLVTGLRSVTGFVRTNGLFSLALFLINNQIKQAKELPS